MWNERFSGETYLYGKEPADFLTRTADLLKAGDKTLVVADGEGRNSVFLAQRGLSITAFDSSPVAVEKAKTLAQEREVIIDFQVANVLQWDWSPNRYDNVVAIFIQFLPPGERAILFDHIKHSLRPGGLLLLHGYRPEQVNNGTGGPPDPEKMYTEDLLLRTFKDFSIQILRSYDATLEEGRGHFGQSALIDLVARKI